jgi:prolyl 4-hydroxylase
MSSDGEASTRSDPRAATETPAAVDCLKVTSRTTPPSVAATEVSTEKENEETLGDSEKNKAEVVVAPASSPEQPTAEECPPVKRRRSARTAHPRIRLGHEYSLQYRRLKGLFFDESEESSDTTLQIGNHSLRRVNAAPNVYVIDNFLSTTELEHFRRIADGGTFQRSFVDRVGDDESQSVSVVDSEHRTSTFVSLEKQQDRIVAAVEQRAATLTGCWSAVQVEPLQLVRYGAGQFFGPHHDLGVYDADTGQVEVPRKTAWAPRRLVTVFCYLNTVPAGGGGATHFPVADCSVQPLAGRAVVFSNITAAGDADCRTVHEGSPVRPGHIKYGLNIWVCEDP